MTARSHATPAPTGGTARRLKLARLGALLVAIGLTAYIFSIRDRAGDLARYGYPGIFLLSLLANATLLLPAPGVAIVFSFGAVFNPLGVGLAAGAGATLGELTGYLAGFSGQAVIERAELYARLEGWMKRNGPLTVFLLALIPNPVFDLAGIAAGALKMTLPRFLLWTLPGKTLKMLFFAYAGSTSIGALFQLLQGWSIGK